MAQLERKNTKAALIATARLRDYVEMALQNRLEQYDINIDRLAPIVPLYLH